jgi:hypothetical protein
MRAGDNNALAPRSRKNFSPGHQFLRLACSLTHSLTWATWECVIPKVISSLSRSLISALSASRGWNNSRHRAHQGRGCVRGPHFLRLCWKFSFSRTKKSPLYVCLPAAQTEWNDCLCDVQRFFVLWPNIDRGKLLFAVKFNLPTGD